MQIPAPKSFLSPRWGSRVPGLLDPGLAPWARVYRPLRELQAGPLPRVCDTKVKFPVLWGGPERVVARASRPLWRERPAPARRKVQGLEREGRCKPGGRTQFTRAGCPRHSGRDARASAPESACGRRGESPLQVNVTYNRLQLRRREAGWGAAGGERLVRRITNSIRSA